MLLIPDQHQEGETGGKGEEPPHRDQEVFKALGDFEGDDEQGDRKGKDRIGKGLDPLYLMTPEPESVGVLFMG